MIKLSTPASKSPVEAPPLASRPMAIQAYPGLFELVNFQAHLIASRRFFALLYIVVVLCCVACLSAALDYHGVFLYDSVVVGARRRCYVCICELWQYTVCELSES